MRPASAALGSCRGRARAAPGEPGHDFGPALERGQRGPRRQTNEPCDPEHQKTDVLVFAEETHRHRTAQDESLDLVHQKIEQVADRRPWLGLLGWARASMRSADPSNLHDWDGPNGVPGERLEELTIEPTRGCHAPVTDP